MYVFSTRLRYISVFTLCYFLGFIAYALKVQNYEFLMYEAEMALIMMGVVWMDRRVRFSPLVLWMLVLWGFFHLAGGLIPIPDSIADMREADPGDAVQVLYNMRLLPWLPRYDQFIHAFGFGTCALAAREALQAHLGRPLSINLPMGMAVFLIALGLGAVNEVIEFAAVLLIPNTNVGGYTNTGWDLVSNSVGAGLAILYMRLRR